MKEKLLNEMPAEGKRRKIEPEFEVTMQEGDFEEDEDEEREIRKFMLIKIEEKEQKRNEQLQIDRERYIRLMKLWVKILEYYTKNLAESEIQRIAEGLYFLRAEDHSSKQLERLERRAVTIIHTHEPLLRPNPRRLPNSIMKVSLIDKKRWVDPNKVQKYDFYSKVNDDVANAEMFNYLYQKAKELGSNQTNQL